MDPPSSERTREVGCVSVVARRCRGQQLLESLQPPLSDDEAQELVKANQEEDQALLRIITWQPACRADRKLGGAIDSSHACSFGCLFRACGFRPRPACAVHLVGNLRRFRDALSASASLATHRCPRLGNFHGTVSLAMSADAAGELARSQGRRPTVPGRLPAPLYGQVGSIRIFLPLR